MRCCCTSKAAAVMASASAIIRRAISRCMAHHRNPKKLKMEASYEANDQLVAARTAKRFPWFLRADGAGDVPAPSACIACFQQAKWWLAELVADLAEFRVDLAGQVTHTSNGPQSYDQPDQCVLDQVLARFFRVQILQHVDHCEYLLIFFTIRSAALPSESRVSSNREGFGHSGATAMRGSKHNVAVKAPASKGKLVVSN